ncbi:MAG: hypothetical protein RIQ60_3441 [Pseudomonadota bacterium]|jgi:hypothetical protein
MSNHRQSNSGLSASFPASAATPGCARTRHLSLRQTDEACLAVENLGGRRYAYRPGYPTPERAAHLGVSVKL